MYDLRPSRAMTASSGEPGNSIPRSMARRWPSSTMAHAGAEAAKQKLRQILNMVEPKNPVYIKASRLLNGP